MAKHFARTKKRERYFHSDEAEGRGRVRSWRNVTSATASRMQSSVKFSCFLLSPRRRFQAGISCSFFLFFLPLSLSLLSHSEFRVESVLRPPSEIISEIVYINKIYRWNGSKNSRPLKEENRLQGWLASLEQGKSITLKNFSSPNSDDNFALFPNYPVPSEHFKRTIGPIGPQ